MDIELLKRKPPQSLEELQKLMKEWVSYKKKMEEEVLKIHQAIDICNEKSKELQDIAMVMLGFKEAPVEKEPTKADGTTGELTEKDFEETDKVKPEVAAEVAKTEKI